MNDPKSAESESASTLIDRQIAELGDWRGETLQRMRALIREEDPDVVEEVKWAKATSPGVPVWSHDGIICTGEPYKAVVKLAIDIREGEQVDATAFKAPVRAAIERNTSGG